MRVFLAVAAILVAFGWFGAQLFGWGAAQAPDGSMEARALVQQFGDELEQVSLQGEREAVATAIRETYAPYATKALVETWARDPEHAPGRLVSSPYPDRIEVQGVAPREDGGYDVAGEIVMMTSTGESGRDEVAITVSSYDSGWVISAYRQVTPEEGSPNP